MRKKNEYQPISLKFVFGVIVIFLVFFIYVSLPSDINNLNKNKKLTFEEMLEYKNKPKANSQEKKEYTPSKNKIIKKEEIFTENIHPDTQIIQKKEKQEKPAVIKKTKEEYNILLDEIVQYPAKNKTTVTDIVNKLLVFKGYPENIIKVIPKDISRSKSIIENSYNVANFDFKTGQIYLSEEMLYAMNTQILTAVLVHELDHFDKLAKVCKYMGVQNFQNLFNENNISDINTIFWTKASSYANTDDIDPKFYQDSLERFITQNNLELLSSYSDFYRLSENMRNPLEISAYEASDYVFNHFGIQITEGPLKKMTQKFNDIDWAIYNSISKDPILKDERTAIFDYYFLKAIINRYPNFNEELNKCINDNGGDLTDFWLAFENSANSFYQKGQMDTETYNKMFDLLIKTEAEIKNGITPFEAETALKYKINTLAANLIYPNALNNLKTFALNYLKYIKNENINAPEQELKNILMLICIENEMYTNNKEKEISLYYLKMPEEIMNLYNIENNKRKLLFIYNHPAFKNKLNGTKTEQTLLKELLDLNRPDIKIN